MCGVVPPLKYIRPYKQQTAQQHGAADLSARAARHGESEASEWADSPRGVGAMRRFVKILCPLVLNHADRRAAYKLKDRRTYRQSNDYTG